MAKHQWDTAVDWWERCVLSNELISDDLKNFILKTTDADIIQEYYQGQMEEDGFFVDLNDAKAVWEHNNAWDTELKWTGEGAPYTPDELYHLFVSRASDSVPQAEWLASGDWLEIETAFLRRLGVCIPAALIMELHRDMSITVGGEYFEVTIVSEDERP